MNDFWDGNYYKHHSDPQQIAALEMLKKFSFKGKERVLDIGCGPGTISKQIAKRVPKGKVIGIDSSMQMLNQAIRDYKAIPNLKFFCKKAETFQFDEAFHVAVSFHALHFVQDHRQVFKRIKSSLKPKGRLLIRMGSKPHPDLMEVFNRPRWQSAFRFKDRVFPLSLDQAKSILKSLGFVLIRAEVEIKPYLFSSLQQLKEWFIGWLGHSSGFSKDSLITLSEEMAEHLSSKEKRQVDIPFGFSCLVIEAHLPHF